MDAVSAAVAFKSFEKIAASLVEDFKRTGRVDPSIGKPENQKTSRCPAVVKYIE